MKFDVGRTKRLFTAVLLLLVTTGLSAGLVQNLNPAAYDYGTSASSFLYTDTASESVEGTGYVMEYHNVNTNNLSLQEYMHGSGSFKHADVLSAQQKTSGSLTYSKGVYSGSVYFVIDSYTGKWKAVQSGASSVISYTKQSEMTQAPSLFAFGTGWYSTHPVAYDSLLKDRTEANSYQEGTAMLHQLEYARAYVGDIAVDLNCTGPTDTADGTGFTHMKIDDDMTQGTIHVAELQTRPILDSSGKAYALTTQGVHSPLILEDKDWVGDFKIQKEMQIQFKKSRTTSAADWLPCTCGGFFDIQDYDKLMPATGPIFDSTARSVSISTFKPAWNGTLAQFPQSIYAKKP